MSAYPEAAALRGQIPARLPNRRLLIIVGAGLAAVTALAILIAALAKTAPPTPPCQPDRPCGQPPLAPPLINRTVWQSSELGYRFEYSADDWEIDDESARLAHLAARDYDADLLVEGAPASEATPRTLFEHRLDELRANYLSLTDDPAPAHRILGPEVAFRDGIGAAYTAVQDSPQGPQTPVAMAIMAAGDSDTSVAATVIVVGLDEDVRAGVMAAADRVLNTFQLHADRNG